MTTDSPSKLTLLRALLSTLIFSSLNGLADEKVISLEIESIVVTGRRDQQNLDQLIGSVGQVNREELDRIAHAHISQAASRLPGVWLSRGNGQECGHPSLQVLVVAPKFSRQKTVYPFALRACAMLINFLKLTPSKPQAWKFGVVLALFFTAQTPCMGL